MSVLPATVITSHPDLSREYGSAPKPKQSGDRTQSRFVTALRDIAAQIARPRRGSPASNKVGRLRHNARRNAASLAPVPTGRNNGGRLRRNVYKNSASL
jgi:hypothetical protein